MSVYIDETAHVSDRAIIGDGTKVWINAQIREEAEIGTNCIISKDVYIDHAVKIGNNVKIQNGVSVFHGVTVADDVFIGPNAAFTNDYYPRAFNADWEISETRVEQGASIGANATIVCRHTLGKYCMVGAGSVVVDDVPPFTLVVGNPARPVGKVCKCGQRVGEDGICPKCGFNVNEAAKMDGNTMAVQIVRSSFEELRMITELDRAAFGVDRWNYLEFISVLQDPSAKSFTAYAEGDFAGFASVHEYEGEIWISTIAVSSEKRGQGIGSALLDRCEKAFETDRVFLNADETNRELLQFYEKRGYLPIEHWERYYQSGHDSVVMLKQLHEK